MSCPTEDQMDEIKATVTAMLDQTGYKDSALIIIVTGGATDNHVALAANTVDVPIILEDVLNGIKTQPMVVKHTH